MTGVRRVTLLAFVLHLILAHDVSAQERSQPQPLVFGVFIASIEEGARVFTPIRLLPFEHPDAFNHEFPNALVNHTTEVEAVVHLGELAGLRLRTTLLLSATSGGEVTVSGVRATAARVHPCGRGRARQLACAVARSPRARRDGWQTARVHRGHSRSDAGTAWDAARDFDGAGPDTRSVPSAPRRVHSGGHRNRLPGRHISRRVELVTRWDGREGCAAAELQRSTRVPAVESRSPRIASVTRRAPELSDPSVRLRRPCYPVSDRHAGG